MRFVVCQCCVALNQSEHRDWSRGGLVSATALAEDCSLHCVQHIVLERPSWNLSDEYQPSTTSRQVPLYEHATKSLTTIVLFAHRSNSVTSVERKSGLMVSCPRCTLTSDHLLNPTTNRHYGSLPPQPQNPRPAPGPTPALAPS
jgi:hypothetical protein